MITQQKVNSFLLLAEELNFSRAAQKLYISQPSLSLSIHAIEDALGVELFVRGKNSVTLTPAGQAYVEWARSLLNRQSSLRPS